MNSLVDPTSTRLAGRRDWRRLAPPLLAIAYPWCLDLFHRAEASSANGRHVLAFFALVAAFGISAFALGFTMYREDRGELTTFGLRTRRAAYLVVAAPTLYVFLGVLLYLLRVQVSDEWFWAILWLAVTAFAASGSDDAPAIAAVLPPSATQRVVHGAVATLLVLFIVFHLSNHLVALLGVDRHAAVMAAGRVVYRSRIVEPVLVALMLFQVITGLQLAWRWSARPAGAWRAFQVASGLYLAVFIVGHMNSVFVYARTDLKIATDWAFAAGAPNGLLHDAWNIRLLPHYGLGVFFVLGHLVSGLRVVLLAHGRNHRVVDRASLLALGVCAAIATAIVCALCGVRLTAAT